MSKRINWNRQPARAARDPDPRDFQGHANGGPVRHLSAAEVKRIYGADLARKPSEKSLEIAAWRAKVRKREEARIARERARLLFGRRPT